MMGKNDCGQRDLRKGVHLKVIAQTITSTVTVIVIGTVIVIVIISMNAIKFLLVILLLKTTTTTSKGIITIMKIILSKMIQDWITMRLVKRNFNEVMLSKEKYQELNHTEHF